MSTFSSIDTYLVTTSTIYSMNVSSLDNLQKLNKIIPVQSPKQRPIMKTQGLIRVTLEAFVNMVRVSC